MNNDIGIAIFLAVTGVLCFSLGYLGGFLSLTRRNSGGVALVGHWPLAKSEPSPIAPPPRNPSGMPAGVRQSWKVIVTRMIMPGQGTRGLVQCLYTGKTKEVIVDNFFLTRDRLQEMVDNGLVKNIPE